MLRRLFASSLRIAGVLLLGLCAGSGLLAQGITTAGLAGTVVDGSGKILTNATIQATFTPTSTVFNAVSNSVGRFEMTGLPVGGPYVVVASSNGTHSAPLNDIQTQLGDSTEVKLVVSGEEIVTLSKVQVTGQATDLDSNETGASSVLNSHQIAVQPTVNRAFSDMVKTNPFVTIRAGQQIEALGINSRFNSITLDGAKINDSFGLNSSGLFSLANPFSLDAVDQFEVSLTPYDVRQSGFAGASINVVSKSGTNTFHGSAYFIYTDTNWQGSDIFGTTQGTRLPLKERTYGYTLGGPLIPNHLFFFANLEKFYRDQAPITPIYTPDPTWLSAVQARIAQFPNSPSLGSFGGTSTSRLQDTKRLLKLTWNIVDGQRLMVRYSDTLGQQPNTGSLSSTSFSQPASFLTSVQPSSFPAGVTGLSSNFYTLDVKEKVIASQLFSDWTPDFKTQLNFSSTKQDSVRALPDQFPEIRIFNVPGTSNTGTAISTGDAFRFGTEISSMGNELHIKDQNLGASGDYTWNTFTFTAGADNEKTNYLNLFRQGSYGVFDYANLAAFQADTPSGFMRAVVGSGFPTADVSEFEQTGLFGQIKWEPTSRFNVTLGLRADLMNSPIAPPTNQAFVSAFGTTNSGTIDGTHNLAPRVSFNYALDNDRVTQLRGGLGIFLGRNPWVWISNSYGNFGAARFTEVVPGTATDATPVPTLTQYLNGTYVNQDPAFKFDPKNPVGTTNLTANASTVQSINLIKPGLKLPTIERGNLAVDRKIPFLDAVASIEYIDTRQLDALFADNMNLKQVGTGIDGRAIWAGSSSAAPIVPGFGNVIRTRDVHAGVSDYVSVSLNKPMKDGWAYNVAYTHGRATEAQTLNSSTANSQWQFNSVFNQNSVEVARSDYEIRDRLQATVSKEFKWFHGLNSTFTLYYEGRTGQPYSFVYANDLNNDGFGANDLVEVPTGPTDPKFDFSGMTSAQETAYFAFLKQSGLDKYAGTYAPRNAFTTEWQNRLDLSFVQDIPVYKPLKLQFFADFLNFGSWIDHRLFNYIQEINTSTTNGGLTRSFGAATYNVAPDGRIKPTFNSGATPILGLDANNNLVFASSGSQVIPNNGDSRWKVQAGMRVQF